MKKINWWGVLCEVVRVVLAAIAGSAAASCM